MNDAGGPNESFQSKLEQLCLHEQLHVLFEAKVLKKCALSHCLKVMAGPRQCWICQIEAGLSDPELEVELICFVD